MQFVRDFWRMLRRNPFILIIFGVVALGIVTYPFAYYGTEGTEEITVDSKERVNYEKSSKYLIYTKDDRVFENTDSVLYGKFNSSNIYAKLEAGNCYRVKVAGVRFSVASSYRNIIQILGRC